MDVEAEAKSQKPRILLINLHSSWNAGDDALTLEALRQLKAQFPGALFTLAMNDPESYAGPGKAVGSFASWVKPIGKDGASRWRWKAFPSLIGRSLLALAGYRLTGSPWLLGLHGERRVLLQAYFQADLVISSAGNFMYTSGKVGLPFLLALFSIWYGACAGKPLYTLPQTLGPFRRKWESYLAKRVLGKMRLVLMRDPISMVLWEAWNVRHARGELWPDLAFAFDVAGREQEARALLTRCGIPADRRAPLLGVTLIHWGAQSRQFSGQQLYEEAVAAAIRTFLATFGGRAVLFGQVRGPTAAEDDLVPARRVLGLLHDWGARVAVVEERVPSDVLKGAYGHVDMLLGTRLHSNIFALSEGVPIVAIGYQYKTRGVLRMLGLERWMLDIEQVSEETLVPLLCEAWAEREHTRAHIQAVLPNVRDRAARAGALLSADFARLASQIRELQ